MSMLQGSAYISQRAKAMAYRTQLDRVTFGEGRVRFAGSNHTHELVRLPDGWVCDCRVYGLYRWCAHTEALDWMEQQKLCSCTPASPAADLQDTSASVQMPA